MTPEVAHHRYGVRAEDVNITSWADRHGGMWVCWVPNELRPHGEQVLYQTVNVRAAIRWREKLRRLNNS